MSRTPGISCSETPARAQVTRRKATDRRPPGGLVFARHRRVVCGIIWMVRFLRTKYQDVEIVFITHHSEAQEVDEETFFHLGERSRA